MPTVFRENGFRGMVRTNDHDPIHVHVFKDKIEFKINANTFNLLEVKGDYKSKDLTKDSGTVGQKISSRNYR